MEALCTMVTIRKATSDDAPHIVKAFVMAIGGESIARGFCGERYFEVLEDIVLTKGSQYYYDNALVAEENKVVVGATIGYDGAMLLSLREQTLGIIRKHLGMVPHVERETQDGEYYVDTLAVVPEWRGRGVGRLLLDGICAKAFDEGHERIGLLVDIDNNKAERLYTSAGFIRRELRTFLGHPMWHMTKER